LGGAGWEAILSPFLLILLGNDPAGWKIEFTLHRMLQREVQVLHAHVVVDNNIAACPQFIERYCV
jgi:hypothetical protein